MACGAAIGGAGINATAVHTTYPAYTTEPFAVNDTDITTVPAHTTAATDASGQDDATTLPGHRAHTTEARKKKGVIFFGWGFS